MSAEATAFGEILQGNRGAAWEDDEGRRPKASSRAFPQAQARDHGAASAASCGRRHLAYIGR